MTEQPDCPAAIRALLRPATTPGALGRFVHYEVRKVLGQGACGIVLEAFDERLCRPVAIKVLGPQLAGNPTACKRFLREARAAAAILHENVVSVYAVDDQPIPYLVMEHVAGETLQEKLDREGPLPPDEVARVGQQVASGLAAAHVRGLIHRDVKPANILLTGHGPTSVAKLADFGLARAVDDDHLTQEGAVLGTPLYLAPEQAQPGPIDHRADLFSLGSVLYAMCTGQPPFLAPNSLAVLRRVCSAAPPPLRSANPALPAWLEALILRLLEKAPPRRFQSAAEVARVIGEHPHHERQRVPPPAPVAWASAARRRRVVLTAGLVAALAGSLLLLCCGGPPTDTAPPDVPRAPGMEFADRPSPADALERSAIRPDLLAEMGWSNPSKAPAELVAILGGTKPFPFEHSRDVLCVRFSPDGRSVASCEAGSSRVMVWDAASGRVQFSLDGHTDTVRQVAFSRDGTVLATASDDRTAKVWDLRTGQVLHTLPGHTGAVSAVGFGPDGDRLVTASQDRTARIWALPGGQIAHVLAGHSEALCDAVFSPDGTRIATAAHDGTVRLWDAGTGKPLRELSEFKRDASRRSVRSIRFSPVGSPGTELEFAL